jgi:RHS repeat-associated protein
MHAQAETEGQTEVATSAPGATGAPWGARWPAGGGVSWSWDPELASKYYRARYYEPRSARFISEDPAHAHPGLGPYTYGSNAPTTTIDPLGLVDLNLFMSDGPEAFYYEAAQREPSPPGVFTVAGHGSSTSVLEQTLWDLSARDLKGRICAKGYRCDKVVRLMVCSVGQSKYPQELANLLGTGVVVEATSGAVNWGAWYWDNRAKKVVDKLAVVEMPYRPFTGK